MATNPLLLHGAMQRLADGMTLCTQTGGSLRQLGTRVTASKQLFSGWRNQTRHPSLPYLLRTCYAFGISPLQLLDPDPAAVQAALAAGQRRVSPTSRRTGPATADLPQIEAFLRIALDGLEPPLAVPQIARYLGVGEKFLVRRYPLECSLIAVHYHDYRAERARQRVARECAEVRRAMISLHTKGLYPSLNRVAERLSDPYILRRPVARATWRTLRDDLGYVP